MHDSTCYLCEGDIPEGDHVAQRNPSSLKYDVSISSGVTDKNKIKSITDLCKIAIFFFTWFSSHIFV